MVKTSRVDDYMSPPGIMVKWNKKRPPDIVK